MSTEQVARDVVMNMTNLDKVKGMVTPDAMASGLAAAAAHPGHGRNEGNIRVADRLSRL